MDYKEKSKMALASFLGCDADDIEEIEYGFPRAFNFETESGEYAVYYSYDDAVEDAKDDVRNNIDDRGIEAFSESFQQEIIDDGLLDKQWFEDARYESNRFYVEGIKEESSTNPEYANRLIEECIENGLISENDLDENGEYEGDNDDLVEQYVEFLDYKYGDYDPIEWFRDNFGDAELRDMVREHNLMDIEEIVERVVDTDGVANSLATYDFKENEVSYEDDEFFIYKTN